jgi:hypothetical protein
MNMPEELFCPIHGPYDASLGSCPYCAGSGNRPPPPQISPLDDELPTDLGGSPNYQNNVAYDDLPTDLGHGENYAPGNESQGNTEISPERRAGGAGGYIDFDEEEFTELSSERPEDVTELDYTPTGTLGILWIKTGPQRGKMFHIKNETVVGRNKGSLILDDPKVSNPHAKFVLEDEQFTVWDFGSKNGTYVNGKKIREATKLNENDTLKIGDYHFELKVLRESDE